MDLKEFSVIYNSASPIFNQKDLGNIISQALTEEQVPHSRATSHSSPCTDFAAINFKTTTKYDTGHKVSEIKTEKNEKENTNQAQTSVNQKLTSNECYSDRALTKEGHNLDTPPVLGVNCQRQSCDKRKGKTKATYLTNTHHSSSQNNYDDLTKSSFFKSGYYQNSYSRSHSKGASFRPENIKSCKCKCWTTGAGPSSCTCSNLDSSTTTDNNLPLIRKRKNYTYHDGTNHDEDFQINTQSLPCNTNMPAKHCYPNDTNHQGMTSPPTSSFHGTPDVVGTSHVSVDDKRKPSHDVGEAEPNKKVDVTKRIIPVEIGCFDKKEMIVMIESVVAANQFFSEFPRNHEPEKRHLVQEQNAYLEKKKHRQIDTCATLEDEKEKTRIRVLEHSVKYIEMRIAESVKFAKKIPGFIDLPLEDQANLIRESRTESGIVGGMRGINTEKGVFTSKHGATFSIDDMKLVFDETLLIEKMLLSKKIAKLNMSLEEEAILRALTITATDRCELVRKDKAEDIHNKLMSCLIHVISEKGEQSVSRRLGKLCDVLVCCRDVTEVDLKQVKKIFLEWPSFSNYKLAEEFL